MKLTLDDQLHEIAVAAAEQRKQLRIAFTTIPWYRIRPLLLPNPFYPERKFKVQIGGPWEWYAFTFEAAKYRDNRILIQHLFADYREEELEVHHPSEYKQYLSDKEGRWYVTPMRYGDVLERLSKIIRSRSLQVCAHPSVNFRPLIRPKHYSFAFSMQGR